MNSVATTTAYEPEALVWGGSSRSRWLPVMDAGRVCANPHQDPQMPPTRSGGILRVWFVTQIPPAGRKIDDADGISHQCDFPRAASRPLTPRSRSALLASSHDRRD